VAGGATALVGKPVVLLFKTAVLLATLTVDTLIDTPAGILLKTACRRVPKSARPAVKPLPVRVGEAAANDGGVLRSWAPLKMKPDSDVALAIPPGTS